MPNTGLLCAGSSAAILGSGEEFYFMICFLVRHLPEIK